MSPQQPCVKYSPKFSNNEKHDKQLLYCSCLTKIKLIIILTLDSNMAVSWPSFISLPNCHQVVTFPIQVALLELESGDVIQIYSMHTFFQALFQTFFQFEF